MNSLTDDALAIANLKALYCRAADEAALDADRARTLFQDVFTDDFVGDYGFDPLVGPAAAVDFLCNAIARGSVWMIHMIHTPHIVVDGDRASGTWTVLAQSRRTGSEEVSTVLGRYSDEFRRTPAGWRIARIALWRPA